MISYKLEFIKNKYGRHFVIFRQLLMKVNLGKEIYDSFLEKVK
jgi:hypothetical protein